MERLGQSDMKRYDRQIILPEIGIAGQHKLLAATVLVIGAGGLGCPLLLYLAGAGAGHIGIIDHDVVDESNLHRQVLYNMADIGKQKADVAAAKLRLFNPDVQFRAYPFRLTAENAAELIGQYDLVIDGSDNFPTRYLVNDICVALNKPLVFGSIFQFEGQVSVFNFKGGADYRAVYPEPPLPGEVPNCGESGVIGTLPGIIGSLMAGEAIKVICGFGEVLSGKLLVFNALNNETSLFRFGNADVKTSLNAPETGFTDFGPVNKFAGEKEMSMEELSHWEAAKIDYRLIDVREVYEYEEYNIGGTNIPLYDLNDHVAGLLQQQNIIFCCSAGLRSKIAVQLMRKEFKGGLFTLLVTIPPSQLVKL
jgi:molybdopterin/thiamine biosynthesis adenylyltransferase/rhodanese-related sulfurtransferase